MKSWFLNRGYPKTLIDMDVSGTGAEGYLGYFSAQARKIKNTHSEKISYIFFKKIFWGIELSSPKLKRILYFPQNNFPYISEGNFPSLKKKHIHTNAEEISYIFQKKILSTFQDDC